jgi:glutamyl-tRNA synthetase
MQDLWERRNRYRRLQQDPILTRRTEQTREEQQVTERVRARFAPSPTGEPHIGNIRTTVFNWLFARQHGGTFILRIEDTDRRRYVPGSIGAIQDGLRWLGLDWDEGPDIGGPYGPYIQSERLPRYRRHAEELVAAGQAYRCNCSPERLAALREEQQKQRQRLGYDRLCRCKVPGAVSPDEPHVIRLAVPLEGTTTIHDLVRGDVTFENQAIDDQILLKSDGFPTYHLAVVVDDHAMRITHIIRAEEWISSTPKHILLYQAFGWEPPTFAHVPIVMGEDGRRLSKRHGATSISEFQRMGYLPEALLNFLVLLGWAPGEGEEQEIFSREELIERFDLSRVQRSSARFSYDKLDWTNSEYIRALAPGDLAARMQLVLRDAGLDAPLEKVLELVPLVQERMKTLLDAVPLVDFVFAEAIDYDSQLLIGRRMTAEQSLTALRATTEVMKELPDFNQDALEAALYPLARETLDLKPGQLFGIIRVAAMGKTVAPPLFGTLAAIGRDRVLARLADALARLERLQE